MNDLISKQAALEALGDTPRYPIAEEVLQAAHEIINAMPVVDAVPVVRCKDCRYSEPMPSIGVSKFGVNALNCKNLRGDDGYGYSGVSVIWPDDYCSDGARMDGEADG